MRRRLGCQQFFMKEHRCFTFSNIFIRVSYILKALIAQILNNKSSATIRINTTKHQGKIKRRELTK
jgi:hypothetical protein